MPPRKILSVFPTFLAPSPPFLNRRKQVSTQDDGPAAGTAPNTTSTIPSATSRALKLTHPSYIRCARCGTDICHTSQIVSKGFTGQHGRAYLVEPIEATTPAISTRPHTEQKRTLPNTITQKAVPRKLVTGLHTVADINCLFCGSGLGWRYIAAEEKSQRYKVGKYILETQRITTQVCWDFEDDLPPPPSLSSSLDDADDLPSSVASSPSAAAGSCGGGGGTDAEWDDVNDEPVLEFDSQDEDECEDLFTGVWSPGLAKRRRSLKVMNRK